MSSYIDNLAASKSKDDAEINKAMLQSHYFDRNGLRGNQNELKNQLNDIMAQTDYGRAPRPTRPTVIDKLNEGDPQDKLNDKQFIRETTVYNQDHDAINPYVQPYDVNRKDYTYVDPNNCAPFNDYTTHHMHKRPIDDWSLTKTIVIVIVLICALYLFLTIIFRERISRQNEPGNMNLPGTLDSNSNQ